MDHLLLFVNSLLWSPLFFSTMQRSVGVVGKVARLGWRVQSPGLSFSSSSKSSRRWHSALASGRPLAVLGGADDRMSASSVRSMCHAERRAQASASGHRMRMAAAMLSSASTPSGWSGSGDASVLSAVLGDLLLSCSLDDEEGM